MNTKHLSYTNFHSYDSLIADDNVSKQLIKTYQNIFGDPELWGETYSQLEVEDKLKNELSGNAGLRLCFDKNHINHHSSHNHFHNDKHLNYHHNNDYKAKDTTNSIESSTAGGLLGFCWAQQLGLEGVRSAIESIQFYQSLGSPKIIETLKRILDDKPVLYVHDLGISKDYRGQVPLQKLICPTLNSLAERSETNRLFFWSIKESRIYKLAQYAGFKQVANIAGMQFFIGDVKPCRAF